MPLAQSYDLIKKFNLFKVGIRYFTEINQQMCFDVFVAS